MLLYLSVIALILIHPGISVSFDRTGVLQWFVIIPLQAVIAFLPSAVFSLRNRCIASLLVLFPLSIWAGGFGLAALQPFFAGVLSFTLTFLLFHYPRWAKLAALEPFFMAWVCLRLLALSRSGEDIAGQSMALTQFILVWTGVVFLLYSIVVYFCLYPKSSGGAGREGAFVFFAALAALVVVLVVLPPDFVRNSVINNLLPERMPERIRNNDNEKGIPRDSGRRRDARRTIPRNGDGGKEKQPELRGISEYEWPSQGSGRGRRRGNNGESSEDNRQYMVMIVASDREPVYMGDSFRGQLDPVNGFLVSAQEPLNRMASQRLFVTWFDNEPDFDIGRQQQEVFSLSTLPQKFLPYRPVSIDPTILNENSGPLRYIHQVVSNTHYGDPLRLVNTPPRSFNSFERSTLAHYLELPIEDGDMEIFSAYLNRTLETWEKNREEVIRGNRYLREIFYNEPGLEWQDEREPQEWQQPQNSQDTGNEYMEKIIAILVSFSSYQYNLNSDDNYSIAALKEFLFNSEEGDCVEFSNTLALLGRLAGIPSRVVTGYLAAESLQTPAHLRGIAALRSKIPVLQKFPFNNLFMVTNLHNHSWTQFYLPDYGWLDFEATLFAIPPVGTGDFNNWDVVIPLIDDERLFSQVRKFPWRAAARAAGTLAVFALVCAYLLRYGREAVLYLSSRRGGRAGSRSLYLLLLSRLAADGKPIKPASKTALEYSELFTTQLFTTQLFTTQLSPDAKENPHFKAFASLYTELRWREFKESAERDRRFYELKQEYRDILKTTRRPGILKGLIRILSLRGLAYL
jgi:hypothetical protein